MFQGSTCPPSERHHCCPPRGRSTLTYRYRRCGNPSPRGVFWLCVRLQDITLRRPEYCSPWRGLCDFNPTRSDFCHQTEDSGHRVRQTHKRRCDCNGLSDNGQRLLKAIGRLCFGGVTDEIYNHISPAQSAQNSTLCAQLLIRIPILTSRGLIQLARAQTISFLTGQRSQSVLSAPGKAPARIPQHQRRDWPWYMRRRNC